MAHDRNGITGTVSRRRFLGAAGAAGLGSALMASGLGLAASGAPGKPKTKAAPKPKETASALPLRTFGRTGVQVTALSQGGMTDFTENQLLLNQSWKAGINYWDTSTGYNGGKSELGYGQFFAKHPGVREKLFLVTKSGERNPEGLEKSLNLSLERMKIKHVDLFFFWYIEDIKEVDRPELKAWAEAAKKAGKIRFIGLSSHKNMASVMEGAAKLGWLDGLMVTYNYRIMHDDDMKRAVDACVAAGLGITAMKTQGGGPINDTQADRELAGRLVAKGFTPEQAKIKAVLEDTRIAAVCSQMPSMEILKANIAAVLDRTKLDSADWKALDRHAAASCHGTCAACGRCERALKGSVPVADVMRHLMYARGYGEHAMARAFVRDLPAVVRGRMASADFSRAERVCPQTLPIGRLMKEAILELA
ncbi:MAG: aldo/keto reductase [Candidatus Coatesbacteria bacterium]